VAFFDCHCPAMATPVESPASPHVRPRAARDRRKEGKIKNKK
jgi:hypothetical protein